MGNDRKLVVILTVSVVSLLAVAALIALPVLFLRSGSLHNTLDAVTEQIENDVFIADTLMSERQYSEAIGILTEAQTKLNLSMFAHKVPELSEKISHRLSYAREEKEDYESKVAQGYTDFEGRLVSPSEKLRILRQREADRRQAEEKETQRAEQQRMEEEERLNKNAQAVANRAYKESAETLADGILRLVSATESGISREEYGERLQTLKLQCDRFVLRCNATEKKKTSYISLKMAVSMLNAATDFRDGSPDVKLRSENLMRDSCEKARYHHRRALAFLADGQ